MGEKWTKQAQEWTNEWKGFLCGVILSIDSFSSIDVGFSMIEALKGQFSYLVLETKNIKRMKGKYTLTHPWEL